MKKTFSCVLVFALAFSCFIDFQAANYVSAYVGWAGAAGIPYVGSANPQSYDVNPTQSWSVGNNLSFALDPANKPCLAWNNSSFDIHYAKWNGTIWVNVNGTAIDSTNGNVSNNSGISMHPSLAIDYLGNPCIAWRDDTNLSLSSEIYFARWNGINWVTASGATLDPVNGNMSNNPGWSTEPSLELDSSNNPCIAWSDSSISGFQVLYARWNGASWVNSAGTAGSLVVTPGAKYNASPQLCLDESNMPHISWHEVIKDWVGDVYYAQWNGTNWINAAGTILDANNGNVSNNSGDSVYSSLALDSKGSPHIAWSDGTPGNFEIYYATWSGANWANDVGDILNATNGSMSDNGGSSFFPSIALDYHDIPNIAWEDTSSGNSEVFFAKKNGMGWVNATGIPLDWTNGNASVSFGTSRYSQLLLDSQGYPHIAFLDDTMGGNRIYQIQWQVDFDGNVELKKSVDINNDENFADSGKTVNAGNTITYKIDWSFDNSGNDPLFDAYVYDTIPEGTTYVAGSATPDMLSYSTDNGITWIAGEPPDGAPAGTRLRWKTPQPGWTNAQGLVVNSTNPNVSNNTGISDFPSLQLDPATGYPCIAWSDDVSGATLVYYAKWNGSQWVNAAGLPFTIANGNVANIPGGDPTLTLDPLTGYPWIAFQSNAILFSNLEIHIVKWNGTQWTNASGVPVTLLNSNVSNNAGLSWYPSHQLALDSNGFPCFVWKDNTTGSWQSYFARWNGTNWVNVSGAVLNTTNGSLGNNIVDPSFWPTLVLDSNDNPYIAWDSNITGNSEVYFARWNGANWVNINGLPLTPTNGNVSNNTGSSLIPYLAIDKQTNNPSIVWSDNTPGNYEICYAKWNGSAWVNSYGANLSTTNGNISNNAGLSSLLSVVMDNNNLPCIAWEDDTPSPGNSEIFFARWNGTGWVNALGSNLTTSNALINSSPSRSWFPSVAVDPKTGNPNIAWLDRTPGNNEVYFAKWTDFRKTFNFSVKISDPFTDYALSPICNQAEFWHAFDKGNHIKSNIVCNSVFNPEGIKSQLEVKKTAKKYAYSSTDIISFVITVANNGKTDILGVNILDSFPRELEFHSSIPQGISGNGTVKFVVGVLRVGERKRFEVRFKLSKNTRIAENGLYITNIAKAFSSVSSVEATDSATVLVTRDSPLKELVLKVLWQGLDTKTNIAKAGEEISAKVMPEGGSSPYEIVIDWGDGTKEKASEITSENYPTFKHAYSNAGEYIVTIICTDQYGKQCKVARKITLK